MTTLRTNFPTGGWASADAVATNTQVNANTAAIAGHEHVQSSAAATWTITHGLGRKPLAVSVWIADVQVFPDISTPDAATAVITFPNPQTGRVELF
jgi:hypothetical protein